MPKESDRFRVSRHYAVLQAGTSQEIGFELTKIRFDDRVPVDLSAYTSIRFRVRESDDATAYLIDEALDVQTGTADLAPDGTKWRALKVIAIPVAAIGDRRIAGFYGVSGSALTVFEAEWRVDIVAADKAA